MKFISIVSVLFFAGLVHADLSLENTTVNQSLQIESSSHYYNFGRVFVNSYNSTEYTITNTGYMFLQFASLSYMGLGGYSAESYNCRSGLMPGQRCDFRINYWPAYPGVSSTQVEVRFYGPSAPEIIHVDVWGEAIY